MSKAKILLVAGAAALLLAAYHFGVFEAFASSATLRAKLLALGPLGYLAFLAAFAFLQPFGLPGVMFIAAASLVWDPLIAAGLSMIGATLASVNGFAFARYLGRDWVEKKLPPKLRKYDERLAERGFATVFVLRAVFWTAPGLHLLFGISRVSFWTHVAASVLAYVPLVLLISFYGDCVFAKLRAQPPERLVAGVAVLAVAVALGSIVSRSRERRRPAL
ncbi:MAG: VTT domain-containing protein [Polyangiaceae bacterium]